jgi:hypothetical protein
LITDFYLDSPAEISYYEPTGEIMRWIILICLFFPNLAFGRDLHDPFHPLIKSPLSIDWEQFCEDCEDDHGTCRESACEANEFELEVSVYLSDQTVSGEKDYVAHIDPPIHCCKNAASRHPFIVSGRMLIYYPPPIWVNPFFWVSLVLFLILISLSWSYYRYARGKPTWIMPYMMRLTERLKRHSRLE